MRRPKLTPRSARRALSVLDELPQELMREVVAGLIDRLDAMEDTDQDCCPAEDGPVMGAPFLPGGPRDIGDEDNAEVDDEDCCAAADEVLAPVRTGQPAVVARAGATVTLGYSQFRDEAAVRRLAGRL